MIDIAPRDTLGLVVSIAVATLLAVVLYIRTSPTLPLRLRIILGVLRWFAQDSAGMDVRTLPNNGAGANHSVRADNTSVPDLHPSLDYGKWFDFNPATQLGLLLNNRRWLNVHMTTLCLD